GCDEVAQIPGLGCPGGPAVDREAAGGNPKAFHFPRSLMEDGNLDFSFSGLKTAVLYATHGQDRMKGELPTGQRRADLAASFQQAVVDVLVEKSRRAPGRNGLAPVGLRRGGRAHPQRSCAPAD